MRSRMRHIVVGMGTIALALGLLLGIFASAGRSGIAVIALGRSTPEIPVEQFLVTNDSPDVVEVELKLMARTNGVWSLRSVGSPCVVETYILQPHSGFTRMTIVPFDCERWRAVAICHRPATRFSSAIDSIANAFQLGSITRSLQVGPEEFPSQ